MKFLLAFLLVAPTFAFAQLDPEQVVMQREAAAKEKKAKSAGTTEPVSNPEKVVKPVSNYRVSDSDLVQIDTSTIERYCEVVATGKLFSFKVTIQIDYGEEASFWKYVDKRAKDETGNVINFNNSIDALNYMSSQGWKLHSTMLLGSGPYVYHYIFKKEYKRKVVTGSQLPVAGSL